MKTNRVIIILLLIFLTINYSCKKEKSPLNYSLDDVFSNAGQIKNLRCLIVYKDNHIIKEKYFHPGDSLAAFDVRSVTKSVISTLTGIAIDKGYIQSEDQTIGGCLQPLVGTIDSIKANIKIRDLLSMTCGISGNDLISISRMTDWLNAPNQITFILNSPMDSKPGQVFTYNNDAPHLMSAILTEVTEMSTFQFAKKYLFQPLGIKDHYWLTDKQGIYNGAAGINLTPYDMLKLGQLYLNKGVYNGVRVVSEEWINKASTFKITTNNAEDFGPGYGYFWWVGNKESHSYFFANGYGGQFIVVVPDLKLIVVTTNNWVNVLGQTAAGQQWYDTLDMIINKIIPLYD
jgi:CubicO group peptidase (beta-lactamase class C family)